MTRIDVQARREGEHYMVECSACGPVSVVEQDEAVEYIKTHLTNHGVETIHNGAEEQPE